MRAPLSGIGISRIINIFFMNRNFIITFIIGIFVIAVLIFAAKPENTENQSSGQSSGQSSAEKKGTLQAVETFYDFGRISMKNGNVSHKFRIKNSGTSPLTIKKMYTSCMCTVASLLTGDEKFGPFGMAGHGFIPEINKEMAPGQEMDVEVVFDPNAHGPAGIGLIERVVRIENSGGNPLELNFKTFVTP